MHHFEKLSQCAEQNIQINKLQIDYSFIVLITVKVISSNNIFLSIYNLKACVHFFSSNHTPLKTMKNVFYFIQDIQIFVIFYS